MLKKKLFFPFILSAIILAGCLQKAAPPEEGGAAALPDIIKIGFIGPLTGNAASYGQDVKGAVELYFKEHPAVNGKKVELIYEDGKCNGQDAASAAQKLVTIDKVQVIIGGVCSGETLAAAPIAETNKVLLFSTVSSSPEVTTAGDYVFRLYPSDAQVAATLVDQVVKDGFKKVALLSEQTDYCQAYRGAVKAQLGKYANAELVIDEAYAVDNADFRTLLSKVKEAGADALVSVAQTPVIHGFTVKQARELGLSLPVYGTDTIDGPDFFSTAKDAAEGVKQVVPTVDPSRESYREFALKAPAAQSTPIFQALAYDTAGILSQAIAEVGYDGTRIKDYLYQMPAYPGVGGDHHFDENGDNQAASSAKVAKDGKFVLLQE